jgi:hypothetical protein
MVHSVASFISMCYFFIDILSWYANLTLTWRNSWSLGNDVWPKRWHNQTQEGKFCQSSIYTHLEQHWTHSTTSWKVTPMSFVCTYSIVHREGMEIDVVMSYCPPTSTSIFLAICRFNVLWGICVVLISPSHPPLFCTLFLLNLLRPTCPK